MKLNFIKLSAYFTLVTSFAMAQDQNLSKTIEEVVTELTDEELFTDIDYYSTEKEDEQSKPKRLTYRK